MTAKISALVSDVDGTLVTKDKILTTRTRAAVQKLHEAGIAFAITSGRPPRGMEMLVTPLALQTPLAGFNGGLFVKPDMTVIEEHVLATDVARRALDLILEQGLDVWVYRGKDWFVHDIQGSHVAREQSVIEFAPIVVDDFAHTLERADKIVGVSDDLDLVARCERDLQVDLGVRATAMRSQPCYLDVTHPSANKGVVVANLSKFLSIPQEEIATIGDGQNDVLMFRESGLSIAMGNASSDVQKEARFITDSNENEGFAKAVERYLLNEGER